MKKLEIKYIPIDDIKPYKNNPRLNEDAIPYVMNSIKEFGFKNPIILDKNNVIVAGHTRLESAKRLDMKEVPVIYADDLTEEQVKAFRLADNKVSEFSLWDLKLLSEELEKFEDVNLVLYGIKNEPNGLIDILDDEGLSKVKNQDLETFNVSFTDKKEKIDKLNYYIDNNSKQKLNDLFLEVVKELNDENNLCRNRKIKTI